MQIWVPDVRSPEFARAAHEQSAAVAASEQDADDQAFVDALSWDWTAGGQGQREQRGTRVRRGDIYTAAVRGPYTGKPRPVIVLQDDRFDATVSITVCPLTTTRAEAPLIRLAVEPSDTNGLSEPSNLMVDKLTTMPRENLRTRLGRLSDDDMLRLNRAVIVFLGLV